MYTGSEMVGRQKHIQLGGLKLNVTHQLLGYADDVNLFRDKTDAMKKNTKTLMLVRRLVQK
jgi:hypothetical protein